MAMTPEDTIAAVSSPPGRSMRGLIRMAGPDALAILAKLTGQPSPQPRVLTPCRITLPAQGQWHLSAGRASRPSSTRKADSGFFSSSTNDGRNACPTEKLVSTKNLIDLPALALCFTPPASYTGQPMVELQCPGHPSLLARVLEHLLACGARMAQPGEFTFRAYLAGKLDLTQAEGVAAAIAAQSDAQLQAASMLRQGRLGNLAHDLVDALAHALAAVEAGIDFTDQEDVVPIEAAALHEQLLAIISRISRTLDASQSWGQLDALPSVMLAGPPSVGKSTLFNALLGTQRSVISAQPGTTRDIITEPLSITHRGRRIDVLLTDAAGLDAPATALDHQVQQAARQAIAQADVLLAVGDHATLPSSLPLDRDRPVVCVRTKADLPLSRPAVEGEIPVIALPGRSSERPGKSPGDYPGDHPGLETLRQAIAAATGMQGRSFAGELLALQPRHEHALAAARDWLEQAQADLDQQQADHHAIARPELIAGALRHALDELASLGGQMTPDDVIGRVFAKFCVGK